MYEKFKPPETSYYLGMPGTIAPQYVKAAGESIQQKSGVTDQEASKVVMDSQETGSVLRFRKDSLYQDLSHLQ